MDLRGTDFVMGKSGESGRGSRLADVCRKQIRQWVDRFRQSITVWGSRNWTMELSHQSNRAGVRLLPPRGQLRMIQSDHPRAGNVEMTKVATVNGIGMQGNRLMSMDFGTVMVPVAAMLMRSRQMRMRRRPLHRHEDGQQDKISRGAVVLLDQE